MRSAETLFPSTGGDRAAVWAILRGGTVVKLEDRIEVRGVAAFWVQSERAGYVVVPADRVKGAVAMIIQPKQQPSAPDPGPTLAIRLTNRLRKRTVHFSARIQPARDLEPRGSPLADAAAGQRQLRWVGKRVSVCGR